MSGSLDWEKRKRVTRDGRRSGKFDPSAKEAFEALSFFLDNPEDKKAGNFVIVPGGWSDMSEAQLHSKLIAHRNRRCAENLEWFNRSVGDRWVRVQNETVETFGLRNCDICAGHFHRQ
jgi:hypothetical protein